MPYWRGKSILHLGVRWIMLATAVQFAFYANPLLANPTGASVVNGAVNMQTTGNILAITASDRSIINWQGFSIGAGETTQFIQPSANASVLNRVTSGDASQIMGALQANGQVYLINPNGVFIGNGATINVGSFLASTANVSDESFMRGGNLTFSEASGAGIINRGTITANQGNVFLLAKTVENSGTIQAAQGTVGLMAGTQFFLKKDETGAVKVKVDSSSVLGVKAGTGVANSGVIEAMQAQLEAQGNVYALAINQSGIIRATGVSRDASGTIVLSAPGGMIRNTGTMLAINRDGSGGRLSISGQDVSLSDLSILTAAGTGGSEVAVGGQIEIAAVEDAIMAGRLDVTAGGSAKGGRMVVTGRRVGVFGGKLDASGGTGGGEILLGGDYQGMNPLVRNAERTYVSQDSIISADATVAGDGGKIINWSDNGTQFYGSATAKGGAVSGNGGFVEVSGRDFLDYLGSVNTLAPNGQTGMLLLDPTDLNINNSSDTAGIAATAPAFATPATPTPANLSWATIASSLQTSAVTISTSSAGTDAGTITIDGAATGANALNSGNSITMNAAAGGSIIVSSDITNTGTGALILNTEDAGVVTVNANITLGGNFTATSDSTVTLNNAVSGAAITLTSSAAGIVIGSGGDITATGIVGISGSTGISTAGDITTTGTAVSYTGAVTVTGSGISISTAGGSIGFSTTITGTLAGAQSLTMSAGSGSINLPGAVGGTSLNTFTVNSAGNLTTRSTVAANNDITIFTDSISLASTVTSSAGNVQVGPSTITKSIGLNSATGDLIFSNLNNLAATAGTVILGRDTMVGAINVGAAPTINGKNVSFLTSDSGQTILNGSITLSTANKALTFDSPVVLAATGGTTTIQTESGGITFTKGISGDGISLGNLTLNVGNTTAANLIVSGTVGTTRLGAITISKAAAVTFNGAIFASSLTAASGAVITTATFNNTQNYSGTGGLNFVADTISVNGGITASDTTNTVPVLLNAKSGILTIGSSGDITSNGAVTLTGTGNIVTAGDITTTGTVAAGTPTITTLSTPSINLTGDVSFTSENSGISLATLNSTTGSNLSITAGTGNVTIGASSGSINPLGSVTVNSAAALGVGSLTSIGAVTLSGTTLTMNTLSAGGNVSLGVTGGTITSAGNITTSSGSITFQAPTTLSSTITLNTSAGNGTITFQNTLAGGGRNLLINSGAGLVSFNGAVSGIGSAAGGAAISISSTGLVTFASTVAGTGGIQSSAPTGSTRFDNDVTLGDGNAISSFTGSLTLDGMTWSGFDGLTAGSVTLSSGPVSLNSNAGNIQFASLAGGSQNLTLAAGIGVGTVTVTGNVSALGTGTGAALTVTAGQTGLVDFQGTFAGNSGISAGAATNLKFGSGVNLANGDTATSMGTVNFAGTTWSGFDGLTAGAVTLSSGPVSLNSNAGNIQFASIAGGSQNLTLAAGIGAGTVTVTGNVTALGTGTGAALTVNNAATGLVDFQGTFAGNSYITAGAATNLKFGSSVSLADGSGLTGTTLGTVNFAGTTWSGWDGLTVAGATTLSTGAVSINSNGGNVSFGSTLAGGSQDLTIAAGTGAGTTTFAGAISAIGDGVGAAITLASTGLVTFGGTAAGNSGIVSSDADGLTRFNDNVTLANGDTASSFAGAVTMDGLTWSGFDGFTTTAVTGILNVLNATTITSNDANITLNGAVSGAGKDLTLTAGTATATVASTMSIANLTVSADEIDFSGGADSITSTGAVLLQGATAATTIGVGGGAGTLDISDTDLAAIEDGATSITIGQALQTALVTVDTSAFQDPVTIRSSGTLGEVQVDGLITAAGLIGPPASVTLEGATLDLNAGIDTAGGAVTLTGGIGGVDLAAAQTIDTAAGANSGTDSGDVSITATGTGTITLAGDLVTTGASNNAGVGSAAGAITIGGINGNVAITSNISALGGASSAGAGGAGGDLSITTTTGTIGLANIDTSGGASSLNNSNGGDAGAIAINSSGGLSVTLNSSTINASGGAAGGGTGLAGDGANITFDNPVILAGASTITTTGDTGGDIEFNDTVSGTFDLTLASGNGNITFADDVGSDVLDPLGIVTVNSVNTFLSSSTFEADEFVLAAAPLTSVTFSGGLNLSTGLTTIAGSYGFSITGASNSIAGGTNFLNQGALVIGDDSLDELTFVGGLATTGNVTNPSSVSLAGTISTTDTPMDLGAVTLTAATILDTGNSAVGVLNVGAVTSGGNSLTLDSGSTAGATIGLTSMANLAGGLTIRDAGGLATIGALGSGTAGALTITDSTSGVTFSSTVNATSVTISDSTAGATISFLGNLTATSMTAAGTANAYNISITGAANTITGATTFANTGTLTLGNGGDAIAFTGGVTATAPSTINLNGNITAAGTGVINLGAAAVAVGGSSTVGGTSTGAITVGNATAADGVTLTVGTGIANAITLGTVTGTAAGTVSNLTVNTTGVVTVGAIGTDIGTVTLTQSGGATFAAVSAANVVVTDTADNATVSFGGNLNVTTGMTIGEDGFYNVALTGGANSIAGTTTFNNTGTLTLGNGGDAIAFTGGVVASAPSTINLNGNITAAGTGVINLGAAAVAVGGSSLVGGTSTGAITVGNATLANGVTLTIGRGIGNTISLGSITGTAAGAVSDLTLNTTGAVTVAGAVGTDIGIITITQSGGAAFQDTVTANTVTISNSTVGADVAFQENLTVNTGMSAAGGTAAYDILITGSSNSIAGNTTFNNGGSLTIGNAATDITVFTGGLTATTPSAGFGAGFVRTAGGVVNLGAVTFTAATTIDTTNNGGVPAGGNLTLVGALGRQNLALIGGSAGTVVLGAGTAAVANLTVTADEINFTGGAGSIAATGAVLLQGATAATTIGVGGGAGTLDISDADLAAIADGATSITIGQSAQTGLITVGTSSFRDSVLIRSSGTLGEVQVDGLISATGATTSVTLQGATLDLNAGIDTAGGAVTLTGGIGGVDLAVAQTINTAAAANSGTASGAVAITATGVGTINLSGDLVTTGAANSLGVGSAGGAVAITSATGTIALADISTSGGASTLANNNGGNAGTVEISSTGGSAVTLNNSMITASGGVGGGGLIGVAGNGAAITFENPVLLATGSSNINTTGTVGGDVSFNNTLNGAQSLTVNAGTGTVTLARSVGNAAGLTNLDITAALIRLNAAIMNLDGWAGLVNTSTFTGLVTLGANVSLDMAGALGNNNLVFTSTVDSDLTPRSLTILAGASGDVVVGEGGVTLTGAVGGTRALSTIGVTAQVLSVADVTTSGAISVTADGIAPTGIITSTAGGDITIRPLTAGTAIGIGTGVVSGGLDLGSGLADVFTSGRVIIGSTASTGSGSGVITIGTVDLSATGYTGFSLLSQNATATFNADSVLTLPTGTDIRFQLGTGNVDGTAELNTSSLSPNLVSAGGTLRFVTVGSVSLYGSVDNLQTSASSGVGGGLVYLNEGTLNVIGSQTAAGEMLIGSVEGDLNLSAQLTGTKITAYAAQNFNNTFGSTAINLQGGRGLVYSTSPNDNTPNSANGGLNGFGAAYLVPTPNVDFGQVGTYTINNAPAGSANLMAYSDPLPVSQLDAVTLNQIVQTEAYLAAVPLTGATLPALPRSDVRLGFRAGAPQQRAPVINPLGKVEKGSDTKGQSADVATPGRLKVSQVKRAGEDKGAGETVRTEPRVQPVIRIGAVTLRPSGDYLPFELAEVTMGGIRISQK